MNTHSSSESSSECESSDGSFDGSFSNSASMSCSTNSTPSQLNDQYLETFFSHKEMCFYKMIKKFFSNCNKLDILTMIDIIEKKSTTSLRVLDWFVTKYSKKKINGMGANRGNDAFDVRISYKAQLKAYKKHYFDPFRRRQNTQRFKYYYDEDSYVYTTLGQLNFFKWAISNNIINFVEANIDTITNAMNLSNKHEKCSKMNNVEKTENKTKQDLKNVLKNVKNNAVAPNKQNLVLSFN
jgi:hypothetical protein